MLSLLRSGCDGRGSAAVGCIFGMGGGCEGAEGHDLKCGSAVCLDLGGGVQGLKCWVAVQLGEGAGQGGAVGRAELAQAALVWGVGVDQSLAGLGLEGGILVLPGWQPELPGASSMRMGSLWVG